MHGQLFGSLYPQGKGCHGVRGYPSYGCFKNNAAIRYINGKYSCSTNHQRPVLVPRICLCAAAGISKVLSQDAVQKRQKTPEHNLRRDFLIREDGLANQLQ